MGKEIAEDRHFPGSTEKKDANVGGLPLPFSDAPIWSAQAIKTMSRIARGSNDHGASHITVTSMLVGLLLEDKTQDGKQKIPPVGDQPKKPEQEGAEEPRKPRTPSGIVLSEKDLAAIKVAVREIGDDDFDSREAAQRTLERYMATGGQALLPHLAKADRSDPEVQRRIHLLVENRVDTLLDSDKPFDRVVQDWTGILRGHNGSLQMKELVRYDAETPKLPWSEEERRAEVKALKALTSPAYNQANLDHLTERTQDSILGARKEMLDTVLAVRTDGYKSPDGYKLMRELPNLQYFYAPRDAELRDDDLKHLAGLQSLLMITLSNTKITDAGLMGLRDLPKLRLIDLNDTKVTDAGLKPLGELKGLQSLHLVNTMVTDAGLKHLSGLDRLEKLYLSGTQVSNQGLDALAGLKKLELLDLSRTPVTDEALPRIAKIPGLRSLNLSDTKVSDPKAIIAMVKALEHLKELNLDQTNLSKDDFREVEKALLLIRPNIRLTGRPRE